MVARRGDLDREPPELVTPDVREIGDQRRVGVVGRVHDVGPRRVALQALDELLERRRDPHLSVVGEAGFGRAVRRDDHDRRSR